MTGSTTMDIAFLVLAVGFLITISNYLRARKKDTQDEDKALSSIHESLLKANLKLDSVCATTQETRTDIKALNKDITEIDRRVTIIERDVKTAFNQIDELKGRMN